MMDTSTIVKHLRICDEVEFIKGKWVIGSGIYSLPNGKKGRAYSVFHFCKKNRRKTGEVMPCQTPAYRTVRVKTGKLICGVCRRLHPKKIRMTYMLLQGT